MLLTNDKFVTPGAYTIELDVKKGKKEVHVVLQNVRVVYEKTLKLRKPMSAEARKNISKAKIKYYKKVREENNAKKS